MVAEAVGADTRPFRLGRNEIRQLIQKYAADPDYRDLDAQTELVTELGRSARTFAQHAPEATEKLISELELTRLELAIQKLTCDPKVRRAVSPSPGRPSGVSDLSKNAGHRG
ncbi:hypothetical protein [Celeribacter ethanolicus]|uniref:hypothetical protein n=1 Tax=Celeribacter ethanolicus TaxID=1758178 RepID=UPI00138ED55E|nr:hypothetical protein [Celeribacter ethanolicus]